MCFIFPFQKAHKTLNNISSLPILFKEAVNQNNLSIALPSWLYSIDLTSENVSPPKKLWDLVSCFFGSLLHLQHDFVLFSILKPKDNICIKEYLIIEEGAKDWWEKHKCTKDHPKISLTPFCVSVEGGEWRRIWTQNVESLLKLYFR